MPISSRSKTTPGSLWEAKPKLRRFADIHQDVKDELERRGWKISRPLKISHATAPSGFRIWFKKQAIYSSMGTRFGAAHTLTYTDLRRMTHDQIMRGIEAVQKREEEEWKDESMGNVGLRRRSYLREARSPRETSAMSFADQVALNSQPKPWKAKIDEKIYEWFKRKYSGRTSSYEITKLEAALRNQRISLHRGGPKKVHYELAPIGDHLILKKDGKTFKFFSI